MTVLFWWKCKEESMTLMVKKQKNSYAPLSLSLSRIGRECRLEMRELEAQRIEM